MRSLFLLLIIPHLLAAQQVNRTDYDIRNPGKNMARDCEQSNRVMRQMPPDVRFSTVIQHDSVYIMLNDVRWFQELFTGKNDGIAIDLVQQEQYACGQPSVKPVSFSHRGFLLPPVYRNELFRRTRVSPDGMTLTGVGKLPPGFRSENVEPNYLILENRNLCHYTAVVNLDYQGWKLLRMGLYYDTLSREVLTEKFKELSKTIHAVVPFEKDKAEYKPADIQPLVDSLRMTDYAITSIQIRAYTSVEGSLERNIELQNQRAQSMINILQGYQSEKIQAEVSAMENWVEFLTDIQKAPYASWGSLSKDEIKEKLSAPEWQARLEPILQKHRKAIVDIRLEKRLNYRENDPAELKKYFRQVLAEKDVEEAVYLQQIIFHKLGRQELPEQFLHELEVPESLEFGRLLINNAAYLFDREFTNLAEATLAFERLNKLMPGNPQILFNLCALRMRAWVMTDLLTEPPTLRRDIEALRNKGIPDPLVRRLLINYHIILSEVHMRKQNYAAKDKALMFIFQAYQPLKLADADLVNLAKYFSHYSKFDWAVRMLQNRARALDASEDLVFYYLSLTIYKKAATAQAGYRTIMLNAVNENRARFCSLFDSSSQGGISFQLLEDEFLKRTFCENCK